MITVNSGLPSFFSWSFLWSFFFSVSLYYNLASFLYKGTALETRLGAGPFGTLVLMLLVLSQVRSEEHVHAKTEETKSHTHTSRPKHYKQYDGGAFNPAEKKSHCEFELH